jgi:hypothetical protein
MSKPNPSASAHKASALISFLLFALPWLVHFIFNYELTESLRIITYIAGIISWTLSLIDMIKHPIHNRVFWVFSLFTLTILSIPIYWIRREKLTLHHVEIAESRLDS